MLAHTNTTRNVSVRACARVRACVTERWRERETCAHFEDCSFFLLFFCTSQGKEALFLVVVPPLLSKNTAKSSLFFCLFFVSFLFCLFYFLISRCCPYKKNHHSRRRRKRIFFRRRPLFFFLCVCFFLSLTTATQEGDRKISFAQSEKGHPFFPWIRTKSTKKKPLKKNESNVTCSSLSFFFEE